MKISNQSKVGNRRLRVFRLRSFFVSRPSERGIALVITLILLSVTLVMALAFLAISRRESSSVVTADDTATARNAAESALARAEGLAMANILSATNPFNFGLLVSTNYINPNGFDVSVPFQNINYDHLLNSSTPLSPNQFLSLLTNLWYDPRPPVFISQNGSNDFRFYLDLNRNGRFETNGVVAQFDGNNNFLTNSFQVGDPEWIGVLEHPDQPHGPNNKFIARYAFIALPVGNSLDLNAVHNQVFDEANATVVNPLPPGFGDAYFRNQGVGAWEINLAAFLADLNTNEWGGTIGGSSIYYQYNRPAGGNIGAAFDDARSLLAYRYNYNYNSLATVQNLFGNTGGTAFQNDNIDGYSDGALMTNTQLSVENDAAGLPWAGADNTNHFFTPSDLFDTAKTENGVTPPGFTEHLQQAGTNNSTYNRYTFYRLLSQLGTDSAAEAGKMNLNYRNVTNGVIVPGMETNFYQWTALEFFTNAADRMLRAYTANWMSGGTNAFNSFTNTFGASISNAFGIGNIPVYVDGRFVYTPAVQRVLQLAANMYDATTNRTLTDGKNFPSVFRPLFTLAGTNIYITGYTNLNYNGIENTVSGPGDAQLSTPFDVAAISMLNVPSLSPNLNIYGVPWIIGAKKGFPNFNEFSMENNLAVTRRLQLTRTTNSSPGSTPVITATNQMYVMGLNSTLGIELWNSYGSGYPGTIQIVINDTNSLTITNDDRNHPNPLFSRSFATNIGITVGSWPGAAPWYGGNPKSASFVITNFTGATLTNAVYRSSYADSTLTAGLSAPGFVPTNYFTTSSPLLFETNSPNGFYLPQFGVLLTNRLQVFMLDLTNGIYHVIDYVHFNGPDTAYNMNSYLADRDTEGVWSTVLPSGSSTPGGVTYGIINQVYYSKFGNTSSHQALLDDDQWNGDPTLGQSLQYQEAFFQAFFKPGNKTPSPVPATNLLLSTQAPYSPTRSIVQYITWQANDPLVHYLASDIGSDFVSNPSSWPKPGVTNVNSFTNVPLTSLNLGQVNDRFMPWGGHPKYKTVDQNPYNVALKDSTITNSDSWDFPTNKFPAIGWLGRVHRGTPWQTVYLKASDILTNSSAWTTWTGNSNPFDATNAAPVQDRLLFDLFTTAFNGNATRGQLSVNVGANNPGPAAGFAAWSALFSGVVVPTSLTNTYTVIQPAGAAGTNSPLGQIVQGINGTRTNMALFPQQSFAHAGDILATPQLTEQSPFLTGLDPNTQISDEMYEWLPQQTMSLLRAGSPRYVIYTWGQTLKPMPPLYLNIGPFFGMVTNYQVVSEIATRAVVRFDSTVTNILGTNSVINNRAVIEHFNLLPPD